MSSTEAKPLTREEANNFLRNNCLGCKHYESHEGCIIQCLASPVTGENDILEWKKENPDVDSNKWTCSLKEDRNKLL